LWYNLGDSGDTFTIPVVQQLTNQGTASGFGATGSAVLETTVKTSDFTAVAGEGYFVNTTGGAVSVNLPAGTAGAVVAIKDYAKLLIQIINISSEMVQIKLVVQLDNAILSTEGIAVTLVFIDSTQGWLVTDSGLQSEAPTTYIYYSNRWNNNNFVVNFKVHTFTGPGTFTVCSMQVMQQVQISRLFSSSRWWWRWWNWF